ncbi:MAG: hypothetical protein G3M78_06775 [Candidatus Nitrohelix vancouverensis]|uniref:CHRD domain-containing protein n=1 Tax=Candidatus Nitrohelix vancouverensis TaxID=2705534 RepID=A0A7T0C2C9_9BACT|nr:MAG: hypothetical protein G3M78_06775 [Candidatus Nitrohelix vancouverensis]
MLTKLASRGSLLLAMIALFGLSASQAYAAEDHNIVTPYFQTSGTTNYTFIAVSHPSLSNMASNIGVLATAKSLTGTTYGTTSFTVSAGNTTRIFVFQTGHSISAVSANQIINAAAGAGSITFTPIATAPGTITSANNGNGNRSPTQLSFWGAIVLQETGGNNGFAMEFIGDLHDSTRGLQTSQP